MSERRVHVALKFETWKKLAMLKLDMGKKTFDDVIKMLLENFEAKVNARKRGIIAKD